MKRVIPKLVLRRETIRVLICTEFAAIRAGYPTSCTGETHEASGCSGLQANDIASPPAK